MRVSLIFLLILFTLQGCGEGEPPNTTTAESTSNLVEKKEKQNQQTFDDDFTSFYEESYQKDYVVNYPDLIKKTNEAIELAGRGEEIPPELVTTSVTEGEPVFTFALEDPDSNDYLELTFNITGGNERIYLPIKKYCLDEEDDFPIFRLCKYDALIEWVNGSYSRISNIDDNGKTLANLNIENPLPIISHLVYDFINTGAMTVKIYGTFEGLGANTNVNDNFSKTFQNITQFGTGTDGILDLSFLFYGANQLGVDINLGHIVSINITNISSMFEKSQLNSVDISQLNIANLMYANSLFKDAKISTIVNFQNSPPPKLKGITSLFENAGVGGGIFNLSFLGQSGTIQYFNKAFKNLTYPNFLETTFWDFTVARTVSEMFYDFTSGISLSSAVSPEAPLHPSRNNAFLTSYRYNLTCANGVSVWFNYTCPEAEEELDLYHRWLAGESGPEPNVMKLVFSVSPGNMTVEIPISDGYDTIWWGDGTSTEEVNQHTYETPGEYTVYVKPTGDGIVYDNALRNDYWIKRLVEVHSLGKLNTGTMSDLFKDCTKLRYFNLGGYTNSQDVTHFSGMFWNATSIEFLDLTGLVKESAQYLNSMFRNAMSLEKVITDDWKTSNVKWFTTMFYNNYALEELDLSHWDVGNGTQFNNMFSNAKYLERLSISGWDIDPGTYPGDGAILLSMLSGLENLKFLDVSDVPDTYTGTTTTINYGLSNDSGTLTVLCNEADERWGNHECISTAFQFTFYFEVATSVNIPTHDCNEGIICYEDVKVCRIHNSSTPVCNDIDSEDIDDGHQINLTFNNLPSGTHKISITAKKFYGFGYDNNNLTGIKKVDDETPVTMSDIENYQLSDLNYTRTSYMNNLIEVNWGNLPVVDMSYAFFGNIGAVFTINNGIVNDSNLETIKGIFRGYNVGFHNGYIPLDLTAFRFPALKTMEGAFREALAFGSIRFNTQLEINNTTNPELDQYAFRRLFMNAELLKVIYPFKLNTVAMSPKLSFWKMFDDTYELERLDLSNWDITNVWSLSWMFSDSGITSLNIDGWNTENIEFMSGVFHNTQLTEWKYTDWNITHKLKSLTDAFNKSKFTTIDVSKWNVSNVGNHTNSYNGVDYAFSGLSQTKSINIDGEHWKNFNSLKSTRRMFWVPDDAEYISQLEEIKGIEYLDVSNVTTLEEMFQGLKSWNFNGQLHWTTNQSENMYDVFRNCDSIEHLDLSEWTLNTTNNFAGMFSLMDNLQTLKFPTITSQINAPMDRMFDRTISLLEIEGHENWRLNNITNLRRLFYQSNISEVNVENWFSNDVEPIVLSSFEQAFAKSKITSLNFENWPNIFVNFTESETVSAKEIFREMNDLRSIKLSPDWVVNNDIQEESLRWFYGINQNESGVERSSLSSLPAIIDSYTYTINEYKNCPSMLPSSRFPETGLIVDFNNAKINNLKGMFRYIQGSLYLKNLQFTDIPAEDPSLDYLFTASNLEHLVLSGFENIEKLVLASDSYSSSWSKFKTMSSVNKLEFYNWDNSDEDANYGTGYYSGFNELKHLLLHSVTHPTLKTGRVANMFNLPKIERLCMNKNFVTADNTDPDGVSLENMFNNFGSSSEVFPKLDLSDWNFSNITSAENMFYQASMKQLTISDINAPKLTTTENMFYGAEIQYIDLSGWTLPKLQKTIDMFYATEAEIVNMNDWANLWEIGRDLEVQGNQNGVFIRGVPNLSYTRGMFNFQNDTSDGRMFPEWELHLLLGGSFWDNDTNTIDSIFEINLDSSALGNEIVIYYPALEQYLPYTPMKTNYEYKDIHQAFDGNADEIQQINDDDGEIKNLQHKKIWLHCDDEDDDGEQYALNELAGYLHESLTPGSSRCRSPEEDIPMDLSTDIGYRD